MDFQEDDPLTEAIQLWFAKMPDPVLIRFVHGLRSFRELFGRNISVGSAFSGCDVVMKALEKFQNFVNERWNIDIVFDHKWCCEVDPRP